MERRDRRVVRIEDFTPEEMEAIVKAEVPPEYAYLDDELKDWKPEPHGSTAPSLDPRRPYRCRPP